ncbi:MAG: hypothetical protein H6633_12675 [Anaerolineales bacterium]|nr:hypothetical protein [Anaerolineales bacterium]
MMQIGLKNENGLWLLIYTLENEALIISARDMDRKDIEPDLLADLRRIARERRVSTQTLINLWLSERVARL